MAERKLDVRTSADGARLEWVDRANARVVFDFAIGSVAPSLNRAVMVYGVKQILADAGALSAGASVADRVAEMQKRAAALRNGTWGESRMVEEASFLAAVGLGLIPQDSTATRDAWRKLSNAERSAVGLLPEVVEWKRKNAAPIDAEVKTSMLAKLAGFGKPAPAEPAKTK